jgi:hypothetical protein
VHPGSQDSRSSPLELSTLQEDQRHLARQPTSRGREEATDGPRRSHASFRRLWLIQTTTTSTLIVTTGSKVSWQKRREDTTSGGLAWIHRADVFLIRGCRRAMRTRLLSPIGRQVSESRGHESSTNRTKMKIVSSRRSRRSASGLRLWRQRERSELKP